jgi:hypothetical protein
MNQPSSITSAASAEIESGFDPLDPIDSPNSFGFFPAQAAAPVVQVDDRVIDPPAGRPRPPAPEPDPLQEANQRRVEAGHQLQRLVWRFPDGSGRVPLLTSSRWALYEALRGRLGADDFTPVLTPEESSAQSWRRRYLEAGLLLFLCLHAADTWEKPRTITHNGRSIEVEPLVANFADFLATVRRWTDDAIPIPRLPDAVALADQLVDLTFSAATVRGVHPDDEESESEEAEKKTQLPDGRTVTSPVSVAP